MKLIEIEFIEIVRVCMRLDSWMLLAWGLKGPPIEVCLFREIKLCNLYRRTKNIYRNTKQQQQLTFCSKKLWNDPCERHLDAFQRSLLILNKSKQSESYSHLRNWLVAIERLLLSNDFSNISQLCLKHIMICCCFWIDNTHSGYYIVHCTICLWTVVLFISTELVIFKTARLLV